MFEMESLLEIGGGVFSPVLQMQPCALLIQARALLIQRRALDSAPCS